MAIRISPGEPSPFYDEKMKATKSSTKSEKMKKFEERISPKTIKDYLTHCRDNFSFDKEVVEYLIEKIDNNGDMAKKIDELELSLKSKSKGSYEPYIDIHTLHSMSNPKIKRTVWNKMKFMINTLDVGGTITRPELLLMVGYWNDYNEIVDLYRCLLTNAKYLERYERGKYRVLKTIPMSQSIPATRKEADYFVRGVKLGKKTGVL